MGERFRQRGGAAGLHPRRRERRAPSLAENGRVFARGLGADGRRAGGAGAPGGDRAQVPENEFDLAVAMARGALARPRGRVRAGARGLRGAAGLRRPGCFGTTRRGRGARCSTSAGALRRRRAARWRATGAPLYRDSNHLTREPARASWRRSFEPLFALSGSAGKPASVHRQDRAVDVVAPRARRGRPRRRRCRRPRPSGRRGCGRGSPSSGRGRRAGPRCCWSRCSPARWR